MKLEKITGRKGKEVCSRIVESFKKVDLKECGVPVNFCIIGVLPVILGGIFK